jgi:hypothetical protein
MKKRKKFITENTKINFDKHVFKERAEQLIAESFVAYANSKYDEPVLELIIDHKKTT